MGTFDQTGTPANAAPQFLSSVLEQREASRGDMLRVWNYPLAAADTIATSFVNLLPGVEVDSFVPGYATAYHRSRNTYDAVGSTAAMFLGAGAVAKAVQVSGKIGQLARAAGMSERLTATLLPDWTTVRTVEGLSAAANLRHSTALATTGRTFPGMDAAMQTGAALAPYGATMGEVASWLKKARTVQAIKEGIALEVAFYAAFNNSEFLFPEEAGAFQNLLFAAGGVGANVALEHLLARASIRKSARAAAKAGEIVAEAAIRNGGMFTERMALKGVVGEERQNIMANIFGLAKLEQLEAGVDNIVAASDGLLSKQAILSATHEMRTGMTTSIRESIKRTASTKSANELLRGGYGAKPAVTTGKPISGAAVEAVRTRLVENPRAGAALAHTGDLEMAARYKAIEDSLEGDIEALDNKLQDALSSEDFDQIRSAQAALDEAREKLRGLREYRAGTMERSGAINYNEFRATPYWEIPGAPSKAASTGKSIYLENAPGKIGDLHLHNDGHLEQGSPAIFGAGKPITDLDLGFDEITALQTLVGRVAGDKPQLTSWAREFWTKILDTPKADLSYLPFPLLDAIAQGKLAIPESLKTKPQFSRVQAMITNGTVGLYSLARKIDWAVQEARRSASSLSALQLDAFDLEKALNMKLTDVHGQPTMGHALMQAWGQQGGKAIDHIRQATGTVNDALDDLYSLALGFAGRTSQLEREILRDDFMQGYRAADNYLLQPGKDVDGVGVVMHNVRVPTDTEQQVMRLLTARNAVRADMLINSPSPIVSKLIDSLRANPVALEGAARSSELFKDFLVRNNFITQTVWAHRYQDAIQHAHALGQAAEHAVNEIMNAMLLPLARNAHAIANSESGPVIFAQYSQAHQLISRGFGLVDDFWAPGLNAIDISRPGAQQVLKQLGDLKGAPPIDGQTPWHMFDVTIAANEGRYVPIQLSREGADFLNGYTRVQYALLEAENAIRRAQGLTTIPVLRGHLPVADFSRYKLRYVQDPRTNQVVGYIKAKTDQEADAEVARAIAAYNHGKPEAEHLVEMKIDQVREHYDALDQAFVGRLSDYSGIKQTGTSGGRHMDFRLSNLGDLLEEHMIAMRNNFRDVKDRAVVSFMSQSMNEAMRVKRLIAGTSDPASKPHTFFDPVDQWTNTLLARGGLPKDGTAARVHGLVEDIYNSVTGRLADMMPWHLRAIGDLASDAASWANGKLNWNATRWLATKLSRSQKDWIERTLQGYQPFTHLAADPKLADYIKLDRAADPYKLARRLQKANRMSTTMFLKHANLMHPIQNILGIAATLPSVLTGIARRQGENAADYAARIRHLADYIDVDSGFATLDPKKLLQEGQHLLFNDPAARATAQRLGFLESNLMEELNHLNDLRPTNFDEALAGFARWTDFINTPWNKLRGRKPGAAGKPGDPETLSERSEIFTRAVAHMAGLAFIRAAGKAGLSEAAQHSFAHYIANQAIADYAPNIRGEAFRGVAGIPFGLFQSFTINMYQRLFGYIGDRNARAAVVQALSQMAIFGTSTLPGWEALNALYFNVGNMQADPRGATSLNERIYGALGKTTGDLLMTGAFSALPQLLGADTGLNIYTSGDLNLRSPAIPPAFSMADQLMQGVYQGISRGLDEAKAVAGGAGLDWKNMAEVVANYAPSRGVRSLMDIVIGERVDRKGNLVVDDTRSGVALLSRLIGTRTTNELQLSNAIWENSQAQSQRIADMNSVRSAMLRRMREGELTEDEAAFWLNKYLLAGGRMDQWKTWMKNTLDKATETRDQRKLAEVISKSGEIWPSNLAPMFRLEMAGADLQAFAASLGGDAATASPASPASPAGGNVLTSVTP